MEEKDQTRWTVDSGPGYVLVCLLIDAALLEAGSPLSIEMTPMEARLLASLLILKANLSENKDAGVDFQRKLRVIQGGKS